MINKDGFGITHKYIYNIMKKIILKINNNKEIIIIIIL